MALILGRVSFHISTLRAQIVLKLSHIRPHSFTIPLFPPLFLLFSLPFHLETRTADSDGMKNVPLAACWHNFTIWGGPVFLSLNGDEEVILAIQRDFRQQRKWSVDYTRSPRISTRAGRERNWALGVILIARVRRRRGRGRKRRRIRIRLQLRHPKRRAATISC